ncbi:MAG: sulfatase family protein [Isosphaeraceae bacterium]
MTRYFGWIIIVAAFAAVGPGAVAGDEDKKPNILVILADDLGPGDLSCYGGSIPTPNIDRMAREGMRFTRYYSASPICSPSRCGLITGQFPARWRITSYLQTRAGNRECGQADFLDAKAPTLPRSLKAAGYRTFHAGKWHLGGGRDVQVPPRFAEYGYDRGRGTWESPEPARELTARDWIWSAVDPVKRWARTAWMCDTALKEVRETPDKPCFVNLWLDDPHTPWVPSPADQKLGKDGRATGRGDTKERLVRVMVELDRAVGSLLDGLRKQKDRTGRPTIVLFISDNGPLPTFKRERTVGLRGSKLSLYEGGVRLPFIAWGPGIVPAGVTNDTTVLAAVDLYPTLCRLSGASLPAGYEGDGEDMSAALLGKSPRRTRPLFWEYGRNDRSFSYPRGEDRSPNLAVLDGNWKLLVNDDGRGPELYNLADDPKETKNRAADEPIVAGRLREAVLNWRKSLP